MEGTRFSQSHLAYPIKTSSPRQAVRSYGGSGSSSDNDTASEDDVDVEEIRDEESNHRAHGLQSMLQTSSGLLNSHGNVRKEDSNPNASSSSGSESDSGSESGSSESESESDKEEERPVTNRQSHHSTPVANQANRVVNRSKKTDDRKIAARDNKSTPLSPNQAQKFWEECPDVYGIRRSTRARKEPTRYNIGLESSSDDESEDVQKPQRQRKSSTSAVPKKRTKARTLSGDAWPGQSSTSSSDSDNDYESRPRNRPLPRATARDKPAVSRPKPVNRQRTISGSSIPKTKWSKSSDLDLVSGQEQEESDASKTTSRRSASKISYKEESENETDSDDLVEAAAGDWQADYEEDDRETIEKVLTSRFGKVGETGACTTIYAPEYEEIMARNLSEKDADAESHYLIKWKGWSHFHNTWESEATLIEQKVKGMKKLENYKKRIEEINNWKAAVAPEDVEYFECQYQMSLELFAEYRQVERVIAHAYVKGTNEYGAPTSTIDYLCKWQGLPYAEASWEDGELMSQYFKDVIDAYFVRERSDKVPNRNCKVLRQRPKFQPVKKQPSFIGGGPDNLQLRDYQLDGLNWLVHSWCKLNSVILADEMGLGKTIQTISFLSYLSNVYNLYGPFLLVVPLSTMAAWLREFGSWAPDINVIVYLGDVTSRAKIREHEWYKTGHKVKFNALLTTYEILLKDKEALNNFHWSALVVDEAHRLKNDDALLYKTLIDFHTNHRMLITGTPLQNSLKELWALLHFIMPERFASWEEFERLHSNQGERERGFSSLHKELEPLLFRRVKKDVEKSLPAKVEQILRIEMSAVQKQYYKWILTKNFKALNKGLKGNSNTFLNIVMELKKCCNHARLINPVEVAGDSLQALIRGSGKLILLDKLLSRLKETGHRVLIFSQMVRMLDILAEYLTLRRFQFQRLDGSVSGDLRKRALDHFNAENSEDFCFLLSTRAGGLGINLATADTVIIFDSDWNPQNDLQAQARAHRIGQKNKVNIYRLVTKGSVEEEIIERAKKKMVLDHLVIQRMDTTGRKVLSKTPTAPSAIVPFNKDELNAILKFGAEELFKTDNEEEDQKLQEMDIDDILRLAETRDTDDHPQTIGEELLSQFKVASIASIMEEDETVQQSTSGDTSRDWREIIPEDVRNKLQEEEEQQTQLGLYLPPRHRKKVRKLNIGHGSDSEDEVSKKFRRKRRTHKERSDSGSEKGSELGDKPKRKRGRPRTVKREDIDGFTDNDIRRFVKSYKKFPRPCARIEAVARDAELEDKPKDDLYKLGNLLHDGCIQAVKDYEEKLLQDPNFDGKKRGATLKIGGVTINAPSILKHEEELEPLYACIPTDPESRKNFRLSSPAKSVHWGIPWDIGEDSMVLVGIWEYGMGSWEAIKADQNFDLSTKILLPGNVKPQEKHLQTRVEYLIKLLKQEALQSQSQKLKAKIKKIRKKDPKKTAVKEEPVSVPSPGSVVSLQSVTSREEEPKVKEPETLLDNLVKENVKKKKKAEKTNKQEVIKEKEWKDEELEEGEIERTEKKPKKKVKQKKVIEEIETKVPSPLEPKMLDDEDDATYSLGDMDKETFNACKEKMRPVKRALKMLESPEEGLSETEQVIQTRQCLLKIGDRIMEATEEYVDPEVNQDWKSNLWTFVSKFTAFGAKKLYKLYKHAAKKREEQQEKHEHSSLASKPNNLGSVPAKKRHTESHHNSELHNRTAGLKRNIPNESAGSPSNKAPRLENGPRTHGHATSTGKTDRNSASNHVDRASNHGDRTSSGHWDTRWEGRERERDRERDRDRDRSRESNSRYHESPRDRSSSHHRDRDYSHRPHDKGYREEHHHSNVRQHYSDYRPSSYHQRSNSGTEPARHLTSATSPNGSRHGNYVNSPPESLSPSPRYHEPQRKRPYE